MRKGKMGFAKAKGPGKPQMTCVLVLAALLLVAGGAAAQSGYDLSWWTVDNGGYTFATGGDYSLGGTIAQPDAGLLTGLGYRLEGGLWVGGAPPGSVYRVYLPVVMRGY